MEVADDTACDDAYFISLVEEAEAKVRLAGDSKRQKLSSSSAAQPPEGLYTAALRGSRSSLWQQQQEDMKPHHKTNTRAAAAGNSASLSSSTGGGGGSGGGGGGGCFKCGMGGHWARDCTAVRRMDGGAEVEVAEKSCPCGSGTCLVLTSNTAKNPGRKFYRCPLKEENGGCNFFEWCDNQSSGFSTNRSVPNTQLNSFGPDLLCPCGAGSCLVLVTRTGKNVGQQYYHCPANEGRSCGFFKWCNEQPSMAREPAFTSKFHGSQNNSGSQLSGERSDSSCFKCGQTGHWARDCPNQSSDSNSDFGGSSRGSSGSGTCFKCNKAGHWARDCPSQDLSSGAGRGKTSDTFQSPYNYKHK